MKKTKTFKSSQTSWRQDHHRMSISKKFCKTPDLNPAQGRLKVLAFISTGTLHGYGKYIIVKYVQYIRWLGM